MSKLKILPLKIGDKFCLLNRGVIDRNCNGSLQLSSYTFKFGFARALWFFDVFIFTWLQCVSVWVTVTKTLSHSGQFLKIPHAIDTEYVRGKYIVYLPYWICEFLIMLMLLLSRLLRVEILFAFTFTSHIHFIKADPVLNVMVWYITRAIKWYHHVDVSVVFCWHCGRLRAPWI